MQRRRLRDEAGAIWVFDDVISGKQFEWPGLLTLIDVARLGDIVCVVRLDRLGRSLQKLIETVDGLKVKGSRSDFSMSGWTRRRSRASSCSARSRVSSGAWS